MRAGQPELADLTNVTLGQPFLLVALSDSRGIKSILWPPQPVAFETLGTGGIAPIHAPLTLAALQQRGAERRLHLTLAGTSSLSLVPLGRQRIAAASNWPHPNFLGNFLPDERRVTAGV